MQSEIINGMFGIGGALIGVIGAWYLAKRNKETNIITIYRSPNSRLLDVEDAAKSDVEIKYKGEVISELFHGEVAIQNTGTKSLEKIEVKLISCEDSPLFDIGITSTNFHSEGEALKISTDNSFSVVKIDYLNPNDRLIIGYRSSGEQKPEVACRKLGVDIELKEEAVNWVPDIYVKLLFAIFEEVPFMQWYLKHAFKPYKLYLDAKKQDNA